MAEKSPPVTSENRIVMAKVIAARWLSARVHPEYRVTVYYGAREIKGIPNLLHSFRDGKIHMGSAQPVSDLGIEEGFDSITMWSANREGLIGLKDWFESRGFETTGVW